MIRSATLSALFSLISFSNFISRADSPWGGDRAGPALLGCARGTRPGTDSRGRSFAASRAEVATVVLAIVALREGGLGS